MFKTIYPEALCFCFPPFKEKIKFTGKAVCLQEDGTPYIERYNTSVSFRIACPSCSEYRTYFAGQVKKIVSEFGAHAIQIDQISCNRGVFCFNKNHPHSTPADNFLAGVESELKEIRKTHKGLDPDFFTWIEGCHERFGRYYDVNQGHGEASSWQMGESTPEQFKYTYPDRIITGRVSTIQQLCYAYAQGKPFDIDYDLLKNKEFVNLVKNLIFLRKKNPQYFIRGKFIDNAGLEASPETRVFGIEKKGGHGLLVTLWLPGTEVVMKNSVLLKNPRPRWDIKRLYPESIKISRDSQWLEIKMSGPIATIIFE